MTQKIVISRLAIVSGDKSAYSTITADYVNIQRMDDNKVINIGGAIGKTFRMYTEVDADIQKGDKLVDEDGNEYKITAISNPASLGAFQHLECMINKVK